MFDNPKNILFLLEMPAIRVFRTLSCAAISILLWANAFPSVANAQEDRRSCQQEVFEGYPSRLSSENRDRHFARVRFAFERAAKIQFYRCHQEISESQSVPSLFRPNLNFPATFEGGPENWAWYDENVHPIKNSEEYLNRVLDYVMEECGSDHHDWDGLSCDWFHAPWMHDLREPLRGLTRERSSRLGELHPAQTIRTQNWAVGLYNDIGGNGFHRIWHQHQEAYPKTKGFAFDDGTVAVKLLFSLATAEQVPYLRFAKTWDMFNGTEIVKARLVQVDVLVKDPRLSKAAIEEAVAAGDETYAAPNNDLTGWVMGSFLYNGAKETIPRCDGLGSDVHACEEARWRERLIPIGLQWGNNPNMYKNDQGKFDEPDQHWMNPDVEEMFSNIRTMSGHPSYLGRDGRMNGPVDNHRSTCLACHGRAVDFGRYEPDRLRLIPFVARDDANNKELRHFFRNLDAGEDFLPGTHSLDYSLQAADGLHYFRQWVDAQELALGNKKSAELKDETSDVEGKYGVRQPLENHITLATWNIANLHHETGIRLRARSPARTAKDFENLEQVAKLLTDGKLHKADIIALQEIGSPSALRRIFSEKDYHLIISDRYTPGDEHRPQAERDIYTAFAISRDRFPDPPKVMTLDALALTHFQYNVNNRVSSDRPVRSGMVLEFEYVDSGKQRRKVSALNVHLKSSCNQDAFNYRTEETEPKWRRFPCRTLMAQLDVIENWMEVQHELKREVVILGDFNRRLNQVKRRKVDDEDGVSVTHQTMLDDFWTDLNDGSRHAPTLVKFGLDQSDLPTGGGRGDFAETKDTVCWEDENRRNDNQPVDFIVIGEEMVKSFKTVVPTKIPLDEGYYDENGVLYSGDERFRLSDHCPLLVKLATAKSTE